MIITKSGFDLKIIQTHPSKDNSDHLKTYVFKFLSPKTKLHYIVRAELHKYDVFAIKFYAKSFRKSVRKYSTSTNKGDVVNILYTTAKVVPKLLINFPLASFGFAGARSIDGRSLTIEGVGNNQRYRLYKTLIMMVFGNQTFEHYQFDEISSYLMINVKNVHKLANIKNMFANTYSELHNISLNN